MGKGIEFYKELCKSQEIIIDQLQEQIERLKNDSLPSANLWQESNENTLEELRRDGFRIVAEASQLGELP